ncbi:MAG: prolyl aminopeptidase [Sphingomonadales bacterium]
MTGGERTLYPVLEPFEVLHLDVGDGHVLYVEQSGNPDGAPVLFLHGGPGGGTHSNFRRYFDPGHYRIIVFDQRGCGQSTPAASLEANTTWHLVADIERIREHLDVARWHLFGGSWGSTLALAYGQKHGGRVASMVLRGIFLGRKQEVQWLFGGGAAMFFPDEWRRFSRFVPETERSDLIRAYYRRLLSADPAVRLAAAHNWCQWETGLLHLVQEPHEYTDLDDAKVLSLARIEAHYFANNCFLRHDDQLLQEAGLLRAVPAVIVQGRYDMITPPRSAMELAARLPEARFNLVALAGHAATETWLIHHLVEATDAMRAVAI